jgi:hypothetical protein
MLSEVEVSWGRAFRVWWAVLRRATMISGFLAVIIACMAGIAIGAIGYAVGADVSRIHAIWRHLVYGIGVVIGVFANVWATRAALRKQYRGFRVALVAGGRSMCVPGE